MRLFNNVNQLQPASERSLKDTRASSRKITDGVEVESTGLADGAQGRRLIKRFGPSNQPDISKAKIRAKFMKSTEAARKKHAAQLKKSKESSTFMAEEKARGDVGSNNPNNAVTVGKLKDLVSGGGFNFSSKERGVLAEILKDR